jgi:PncC family amidohydrolase
MRDLQEMGGRVAALLKARGETVAVAESSAGGLVAASLLSIAGASVYFRGGAVVYTLQARQALTTITLKEMRRQNIRSSSEPYASLLSQRIRASHDATWGLAETGAAGPTGNRYGDAAGHTCLAVDGPVALVRTLETGSADRLENMWVFAEAALALFVEALEKA